MLFARKSEPALPLMEAEPDMARPDQFEILREALTGRYAIERVIGAGGMATIYLAREERHDRMVALKVLQPAIADAVGAERFLREIRIAARLHHPHILTLLDSGETPAGPYYVMPFVDGESLQDRLEREGQLPVEEAVRFSLEIASALEYAHRQGVLHRDIKPGNIMLADGHAFVTDFGIARAVHAAGGETLTSTGIVLGTPAYMSPEQTLGDERMDGRSDLYSLACVVFEMLAGRAPFVGATVESVLYQHRTVAAPAVTDLRPSTPHRIAAAIDRALRKTPADRQTGITSFVNELASGEFSGSGAESSGSATAAPSPMSRPRSRRWWVLVGAGALAVAAALAVGGFMAGRKAGQSEPYVYQQLTFRSGNITNAAYMPDERSVVYSAAWDGEAEDIYFARADFPESRSLGLRGSRLASVSGKGELAILTNPDQRIASAVGGDGTLARVSPDGGTPRPILEHVNFADWHPDAERLLVVRRVDGHSRLEFPVGTVLYESRGWISSPRFSPDGSQIALIDNALEGTIGGPLILVDLSGRSRTLLHDWGPFTSLAWSPDGREIWFSGWHFAEQLSLYATDLSGHVRSIARGPTGLWLCALGKSGDPLVYSWERGNIAIAFQRQGSQWSEREITWLDWTRLADISADGREYLLSEYNPVATQGNGLAGIRTLPDMSIVSLGEFDPFSLSPDGRLVLGVADSGLVVVPTGPGARRELITMGRENIGFYSYWMRDSRHVLSAAREHDVWQTYMRSIDGGPPEPIGKPGWTPAGPPRPDGGAVLLRDPTGHEVYLVPLDGRAPTRVDLRSDEGVVQWRDAKTVYVTTSVFPCTIDLLDVATGKRTAWEQFEPRNRMELSGTGAVRVTPDGQAVAISARRTRSSLQRLHAPAKMP
jgi:eukaryotic-like serine/threonine-protein kinase